MGILRKIWTAIGIILFLIIISLTASFETLIEKFFGIMLAIVTLFIVTYFNVQNENKPNSLEETKTK